jgi:hypothetical protein
MSGPVNDMEGSVMIGVILSVVFGLSVIRWLFFRECYPWLSRQEKKPL